MYRFFCNYLFWFIGGSGIGDDGICMATADYASSGGMVLCTNDVDRAIAWAGETGWWCCNCSAAIERCSGLIS